MAFADRILALSPSAYWKMGEASGNLADSTANGNTMVKNGTPTYGVPGGVPSEGGKAISFPNNAASFFQAAFSASLDVADTFSIWMLFKPNAIGAVQCMYSRPTNGPDFRIDATGKLQLIKSFVGSILTAATPLTAGRWQSVGVTKAGLNTAKLYLNGVLDSGADASGVAIETVAAGVSTIGKQAQGGNLPVDGVIQHCFVVNGAVVTAAQFLTLHQAAIAMLEGRRRRR